MVKALDLGKTGCTAETTSDWYFLYPFSPGEPSQGGEGHVHESAFTLKLPTQKKALPL